MILKIVLWAHFTIKHAVLRGSTDFFENYLFWDTLMHSNSLAPPNKYSRAEEHEEATQEKIKMLCWKSFATFFEVEKLSTINCWSLVSNGEIISPVAASKGKFRNDSLVGILVVTGNIFTSVQLVECFKTTKLKRL